MKLYYTKGTCSFVPHVTLREVGAEFDLVAVDLFEKKLADDGNYLDINPRGYVPLLECDDGRKFAECAVIIQYLADQFPDAGLAPPPGSDDRYRLQEWLSFIGAEMHKSFPQLYLPYIPEEMRPVARQRVATRMNFLDEALAGRQWLMGDRFTVADAYCGGILNWAKLGNYDLADHPNVAAYHDRYCDRDSVKEAHAAEA